MNRTADVVAIAGLAALVLAAKASVLGTPAYWDELGWLGRAFALSDGSLIRALPGFRPADAFSGHPPGLHLIFAVLAKFAGASLVTAHVVSTAFAAAGVCFTYLLGKHLVDRTTGLVAALLLLLSPMYFAQAGMFLADLPVAALAAGSVYFALIGRRLGYVILASAMVLIKETSAAVVVALLVYELLVSKPRLSLKSPTLWIHSAPLVVLGAFFIWQKLATSYVWLIYPGGSEEPGLTSSLRVVAHEAIRASTWLFVAQSRVVLTVAIALACLLRPEVRRRRELWLLALIGLLTVYPYAVSGQFFLPRYLLPALPFFYLAGAWSLMRLVTVPAWRTALAIVTLAGMTMSLVRQPFFGSAELAMRYRDVVAVHQEMAAAIAHDFPGARVLTLWPHTAELEQPRFGYVTQPMIVVPSVHIADLVWVTVVPDTPGMQDLRARVIAAKWRLLRRVARDPVVSELYGPPGS